MSERTCAACRTKRPKPDLIRFVRTSSGRVLLDLRGSLAGRGGYTCRRVECVERALEQGGLARTLRASISSDDAERLKMQAKEYLLI